MSGKKSGIRRAAGAGTASFKRIIIRNFQPDDADRVLKIAISAWKPVYADYLQTMGRDLFDFYHSDWKRRKKREILKACRKEEGVSVYVAEMASEIAGFVSCQIDKDEKRGVIGNNAVHPLFQRKGIAQVMYQFCLNQMKEQGVQYVSVLTGGNSSHAPARKAYEKIGFSSPIPRVTYYRKL